MRSYNSDGIRYACFNEPLLVAAATIAYEVVLNGTSSGWAGTIEEREEVGKILAPLGIRYVDDMRGEWKR